MEEEEEIREIMTYILGYVHIMSKLVNPVLAKHIYNIKFNEDVINFFEEMEERYKKGFSFNQILYSFNRDSDYSGVIDRIVQEVWDYKNKNEREEK